MVFHSLQGYDSHLFIKQFAKVKGELSCISSTEEKYISFSKKIKVDQYISRKNGVTLPIKFEIRFIDSFKFLQTPLANLVSNLQPSDFQNLNNTQYPKKMYHFLQGRVVIHMIMFHRLIFSKKPNFHQKKILFKTKQ